MNERFHGVKINTLPSLAALRDRSASHDYGRNGAGLTVGRRGRASQSAEPEKISAR
jgi:hypothetical protein